METQARMRRPNSDFQQENRLGFLKSVILCVFARPVAPDIGNVVKFVLDALNKLICADDKQVVKPAVRKPLDSAGQCEGHTQFIVS